MKRAGYFVLLLKGSIDEDDSDNDNAYKEALLPAQSLRVPVLEFESIKEGARAVLSGAYDAIIVTSARAIWSLKQHLSEAELLSLRRATWFVVGKGTADSVKQSVGPERVLGDETGNAVRLVELLRGLKAKPSRVCFICGNLRGGVVEAGLNDIGIPFDTSIAYRTIPVKHESLQEATSQDLQRIIAFFSPSGVEAANGALRPNDKILAIGETTAKALKDRGLSVSAVAPEPTPQGLAIALDNI